MEREWKRGGNLVLALSSGITIKSVSGKYAVCVIPRALWSFDNLVENNFLLAEDVLLERYNTALKIL